MCFIMYAFVKKVFTLIKPGVNDIGMTHLLSVIRCLQCLVITLLT